MKDLTEPFKVLCRTFSSKSDGEYSEIGERDFHLYAFLDFSHGNIHSGLPELISVLIPQISSVL